MALSKEQWLTRLKGWVQSWRFEDPNYQEAIFSAISKLLSEAELNVEDTVAQTFITEASAGYLDLHGSERSIDRFTSENDLNYSVRIRYIKSTYVYSILFELIKSALNNGEPILIENFKYGYCDDEFFLDQTDSVGLSIMNENMITILIPIQTGGDESTIKQAIVDVINKNKAAGVMYEVLYGV